MMMMKNNRQDVLEFLSLVACENDNNTESRGRASSCGKKCCFYFRPFEMEMSRPYLQRETALLKTGTGIRESPQSWPEKWDSSTSFTKMQLSSAFPPAPLKKECWRKRVFRCLRTRGGRKRRLTASSQDVTVSWRLSPAPCSEMTLH